VKLQHRRCTFNYSAAQEFKSAAYVQQFIFDRFGSFNGAASMQHDRLVDAAIERYLQERCNRLKKTQPGWIHGAGKRKNSLFDCISV
jgi:hypothetical protein